MNANQANHRDQSQLLLDELVELKGRYERLNLLYQVSTLIHSSLEPQKTLQRIVEEAVRVVNASSGSVVLINPTTGFLEIHASHGLPERAAELRLKVGEGITGRVARTGKPLRVGDVSHDPFYVMLRPDVVSELAVPLEVDGETRGVLNVDSNRQQAFSAADQELLEVLAAQAAIAIHHTWLYEQLRLKLRLFESLVSVSRTINSSLNLDDVLSVITREGASLVRAKVCALMLLDGSRQWLDLRACHGGGDAYRNKPRLTVNESLVGTVVRRRKPLQVDNVQVSNRYQHLEIAREEGLFALLSVPLLYGGQAIGVLSVYTGQPYSFSNEEIRILTALAELSAIAIEKARLYERVVDTEEQLRQHEKLSALGLLAAEVAHEIRNPLTVMKMLYQALDLRFPATDPRAKDVRIIGEKMEHLNKIVEQILDFARSTEPEFELVDLNALIGELGLLVRHKLKNQGVQWETRLDPLLPPVRGQTRQLEQAFLNLILNAAEAMPGGGTLTIRTSALHVPRTRPSPSHVTIEFQDTGGGMPLEQIPGKTSMLRSTKAKGTGIGLAIVHRVAETHQGKVKFKSRPGVGTRVSILLPVPK